MLAAPISRIIAFCVRHARLVIVLSLLIAVGAALYTAQNFAINTGFDQLIPRDLPWRQRSSAYDKLFPGTFDSILAVVDAPTPEMAASAGAALAQKLSAHQDLFHSVREPAGSEFFRREGLMYLPLPQVRQISNNLARASPLIRALTSDPSLRGLTRALSFGLAGIRTKAITLDDMSRPLSMAAHTVEKVLDGRPATFSWQVLLQGHPSPASALRRYVIVRPKLNYAALAPGEAASKAIRQTFDSLDPQSRYQTQMQLTGPIPIQDEEFASIQQGAFLNLFLTVLVVLTILWLALRSFRIIGAVFINVAVGLAITAAVGLMLVGSLNMISVAFAVLFIGLGADFSIQFAVRYRAERHGTDALATALRRTAEGIGAPLTLAATAVAAAFLSFLPTDYRGVAELGEIAGSGMLFALGTTLTLLPALLVAVNPAGEPAEVGYRALAPIDRFLEKHRVPVVVTTLLAVLAATPLLLYLHFDFNPMHLRNPDSPAVAALRAIETDPNVATNAINVLRPSVQQAQQAAAQLKRLPEVASVHTVQSFIPQDQDEKLKAIHALNTALASALNPRPQPEPTDEENVAALRDAGQSLTQAAGDGTSSGARAAKRLAADLSGLANADKAARDRASSALLVPLQTDLAMLRDWLQARPVTLKDLPSDLVRQWVAPGGQARVEVLPKGDPENDATLSAFADAVMQVAPNAVGGPIAIVESSRTILGSFVRAGIYALLSIAVLLWIVLRRLTDVALTLVPLLLAGVVTLECCVLIGWSLNFANIIALPLLLGIGVAFKIYYIMAWRSGQANLLQSSLTRAVIWSALTTATAFGSLWFSNHPGTSSMGKLLALSLVCTLAAAVLFQPALMGRPRSTGES